MKYLSRIVTLLLLCICLSLPVSALSVPNRPDNRYVLDEGDVLTSDFESYIIRKNNTLFSRTGAEIVVVAVDFTSGSDFEAYSNALYNEWGIGSKERNNGLLLVMSIGEDDYWATSGYGVKSLFTASTLNDMFDRYLETDFASQNYNSGAQKFFDAAYEMMENYYATYTDEYSNFTSGGSSNRTSSSAGWVFSNIIRGIVILGVVLVIISFITRNRGGGGYGSGGGYGGGGGGFWNGLLLGGLLNNRRRYGGHHHHPPHNGRGSFGGFGGGGFTPGGGRSGGGAGRGGFGGGGGFSSGGRSHGGGAGRGGAGRR